jgi:hypothetical protein
MVSTAAVDLGSPTPYDFDRGHQTADGPAVGVRANRPYRVDLSAERYFRYSGDGRDPRKPASDVRWGVQRGVYPWDLGRPHVLMTDAGGGQDNGASDPSRSLFFQIAWDFERDPPGTYTLDMHLTISAP